MPYDSDVLQHQRSNNASTYNASYDFALVVASLCILSCQAHHYTASIVYSFDGASVGRYFVCLRGKRRWAAEWCLNFSNFYTLTLICSCSGATWAALPSRICLLHFIYIYISHGYERRGDCQRVCCCVVWQRCHQKDERAFCISICIRPRMCCRNDLKLCERRPKDIYIYIFV